MTRCTKKRTLYLTIGIPIILLLSGCPLFEDDSSSKKHVPCPFNTLSVDEYTKTDDATTQAFSIKVMDITKELLDKKGSLNLDITPKENTTITTEITESHLDPLFVQGFNSRVINICGILETININPLSESGQRKLEDQFIEEIERLHLFLEKFANSGASIIFPSEAEELIHRIEEKIKALKDDKLDNSIEINLLRVYILMLKDNPDSLDEIKSKINKMNLF